MNGQDASYGGAALSAVGSYFGGPVGGSVGNAIGSLIGGLFGPSVHTTPYGETTDQAAGIFKADVQELAALEGQPGPDFQGGGATASGRNVLSGIVGRLLNNPGLQSSDAGNWDAIKANGTLDAAIGVLQGQIQAAQSGAGLPPWLWLVAIAAVVFVMVKK